MLLRSSALGSSCHGWWLVWLVLVLAPAAGWVGCGSDQLVLVTAIGLDGESLTLVAEAHLDGMPVGEAQSFPATPPYFYLTVPQASRGRLEVILEAQDGDGCSRARGRGFVELAGSKQVAVDVFLIAQPAATCLVKVKLPEQMVSRVVSTGGELSCSGSCQVPVRKGTALNVRVEPAIGEHLLGFRSPCLGTEPCQFVVQKPVWRASRT